MSHDGMHRTLGQSYFCLDFYIKIKCIHFYSITLTMPKEDDVQGETVCTVGLTNSVTLWTCMKITINILTIIYILKVQIRSNHDFGRSLPSPEHQTFKKLSTDKLFWWGLKPVFVLLILMLVDSVILSSRQGNY